MECEKEGECCACVNTLRKAKRNITCNRFAMVNEDGFYIEELGLGCLSE